MTGDSFFLFDAGEVIAADASGDFVVVWQSFGQDGSSQGIFGQRYDSAGDPEGSEFRVNTTTAMPQESPAVASDPEGNFVVVWHSLGQDGEDRGIFGQRYDSAGAAQGGEFQINSYTPNNQTHASVTSDPNGNFVVAWQSSHTGNPEIFARRYDSAGNALGSEFRVNSYTTGYQIAAAVASDPAGNFVVVWFSYPYPSGQSGVFGQRYDGAGSPLGAEFEVSNGGLPSISSDASGNFVVVWNQLGAGGAQDIWGRRYDAGGVPLGPQFAVNTYTPSQQRYPQVASDADGNFVVVWQSEDQDGQDGGVFGRRYDSAGVAQGPEFQINSHTTGNQKGPSVEATGTNQFTVAWTSPGLDGSGTGVFGQRFDFGGGAPTLHAGDLDGRSSDQGANWAARDRIEVHDSVHAPVSAALATVRVTSGVGNLRCTTGATGTCSVLAILSDNVPSLTFSVTDVSKTGFTYAPADNHDPDGDSDGTTIVVLQ